MSDEAEEQGAQERDELVSAVLDGVASPRERALVESDPALTARLEQFRAVRRILLSDAPDLLESPAEASLPMGDASAGHVRLDDVRAQRRQGHSGGRHSAVSRRSRKARQRRSAALSAAAALILLSVGVGLVVARTEQGSFDEGASATDSGVQAPAPDRSAAEGAGGETESAPEAQSFDQSSSESNLPGQQGADVEGAAGGSTAETVDLGRFATVEDLLDTFEARRRTGRSGASAQGPCAGELAALGTRPAAIAELQAGAVAAGAPLASVTPVVIGATAEGGVVLEIATCRRLA